MEKMQFPCNACGACCQKVTGVPTLDRGDGICIHFDEKSKLCLVYESRPLVCNVDKAYATYFIDKISPQAYYMTQAVSCVEILPQNIDMPLRTEEALRKADLYDESEIFEAEQVKSIVVKYFTIADLQLAKIPKKQNKNNLFLIHDS